MTVLKKRIYTILNGNARDKEPTTDAEGDEELQNIYGVEDPTLYLENLNNNIKANMTIQSLNTRIFGIPHQFLETTDLRLDDNNNFGFCFFNHIYMEKPIATLMPGKMLFLPGYSKDNKALFGALMGQANSDEKSAEALGDLIDENSGSRYYDFTSDYTAYMTYVNLMCRVAAVYLGLDDVDKFQAPDGGNYKNYDWKKYHNIEKYEDTMSSKVEDKHILSLNNDFFNQVKDDITSGQRCYVNFYIDPNTSVSENISNSTQQSMLEGAFDKAEGIMKEAQMLIGTIGSNKLQGFVDDATSMVKDVVNAASFGFFKNLLGLGEEVLHGSNLIYPEIWTDSEYSKSFSLQINLASPYGTKEAIYLNVLVPLFHALCLALPKQSTENSYNAPFLIRGYAQGWFSIDMGIVESITIDRGPEQSWSVEGLPTQAKVTLNIKELYSNLMMSPSTKPSYFFSNQGLIDYLGVTCGVDMSVPNIYFNFRLAYALLTNKFTDMPNNFYFNVVQSVRQFVSNHVSHWNK